MLEPNIEVHKPNARGSRPSSEEMAKWNAEIGMEEEPGEDLGARALREHLEIQDELNDSDRSMIKAVQEYFVHRFGDNPEEHRQIARDLAEQAGVNINDLSVDLNELIEQVREQMEALDLALSQIAQKLVTQNPVLKRSTRNLSSKMILTFEDTEARNHPNIDEDIIYAMVDRIAGLTTEL